MTGAEDVRGRIDEALELAVAGNVDLDEVEAALTDAQDRVDQLRVMRGDA